MRRPAALQVNAEATAKVQTHHVEQGQRLTAERDPPRRDRDALQVVAQPAVPA